MVGKKKSGKQTLYFRLRFWEIFKLDTTIFMSLPQQYFLYSESQVRSLSWRGVGGQEFGEGGQVRGSFLHWSPGIETNRPKNLEYALGCRFVIVKNNLVDSGGFTLKKQGISSLKPYFSSYSIDTFRGQIQKYCYSFLPAAVGTM